ncbi:hypothetical protein LV457_09830 [Mycobacterium sp. MYCO198283]|uniref:hypothetical protein n=1 Tax=Mycobacterium sp. MYCO198283 TaxID=2883505 RepID=UPI001E4C2AAC|nr:hypothetical protein [Mycobacterium sp. MYCO198283]MCG5432585.1 hypothetical protein [Mycobacterium sp. MYCO198283]
MKFLRWMTVPLLLLVPISVVAAGPAAASEPIQGVYLVQQEDGPAARWDIFPSCVPGGCKLVIISKGDVPGGDARLTNVLWQFPVNKMNARTCPDGSTTSEQEVVTFDDVTMTGVRKTLRTAFCGEPAGMVEKRFTLTYLQPLSTPVEPWPLTCYGPNLTRCY